MNIPLEALVKLGLLVGLLIGIIILNRILPGHGRISITIGAILIVLFLIYEWKKVSTKNQN
jgi:hypothetical protein